MYNEARVDGGRENVIGGRPASTGGACVNPYSEIPVFHRLPLLSLFSSCFSHSFSFGRRQSLRFLLFVLGLRLRFGFCGPFLFCLSGGAPNLIANPAACFVASQQSTKASSALQRLKFRSLKSLPIRPHLNFVANLLSSPWPPPTPVPFASFCGDTRAYDRAVPRRHNSTTLIGL